MINWYRAQVTGDVPSSVYKHTATMVGTKVYLFGTIDVQTAQQLVLPVDAQPLVGLAKDREAAQKVDQSELDKIYIFDTGSLTLRFDPNASETFTWSKKRASGTIPSPRLAHSSTAIGDKVMINLDVASLSNAPDLHVWRRHRHNVLQRSIHTRHKCVIAHAVATNVECREP